MTHILYLAHDLDDAAIRRRVTMLARGGATVSLAGFSRGALPPPEGAISLGRTADGRMLHRGATVVRLLPRLMQRLRGLPAPDVILARNLEMLVLARRARLAFPGAALVYEALDIHRMMLGSNLRARTLRGLERGLLRGAGLVLTSSPGFIRHYFDALGQAGGRQGPPVLLVENRCLDDLSPPDPAPRPAPGPLVIGWSGILRCAASLTLLDAVTRADPGRFRVVMRGRPALDALPGFHATVAANPDLAFGGPYRNPEDLADIYDGVHLAWLVDRFDAGQNSDWLLPNRLYEGCRHGAIPLALEGTEAAVLLAEADLGLHLRGMTAPALAALLEPLDGPALARLQAGLAGQPAARWTADAGACRALVAALARAGGAVRHIPPPLARPEAAR